MTPTLVLLHAFPLTSAMWAAQREALAGVCRLVVPNQRGFGGTPLGTAPPDLGVVADDVTLLLDSLGVRRAYVGGLSMGGYVALAFLRRYPERVAGLVLADTKAAADPPEAAENRRRIAAEVEQTGDTGPFLAGLLPKLVGAATRAGRPEVLAAVEELASRAPAASIAWAQRAMAARPDSSDLLPGVQVPALVVVGEDDGVTPPDHAEAMAAALPRATLERIPGAGHLSAMEDPARFNAALRRFVGGAG